MAPSTPTVASSRFTESRLNSASRFSTSDTRMLTESKVVLPELESLAALCPSRAGNPSESMRAGWLRRKKPAMKAAHSSKKTSRAAAMRRM